MRPQHAFMPAVNPWRYGTQHFIKSSTGNILHSYHAFRKLSTEKIETWLDTLYEAGILIVLDSGAFSAYTLGDTIDIDEYAKFRIKYSKYIAYAFTLDVIGDPTQTYENYVYLKKTYPGVDFIPVWQVTASLSEATRLLDAGASMLGIGGVARCGDDTARKQFISKGLWLAHRYNIKLHALGIGAIGILMEHAVDFGDSTSWQWFSWYGRMWSPFDNWDSFCVSSGTRKRPEVRKEIDDFFAEPEREAFVNRVLTKLDLELYDVFNDNELLALYNLEAFITALDGRDCQKIITKAIF